MPTTGFEKALPDELHLWGARVFENIRKNFRFMDINDKKSRRGSGDLYRSIWWDVYNSANGNLAWVKFFYMNYGDFVQWGVGRGVKKWPVPPMTSKEPIKHPQFNRRAKAFMRSEIMRNARWLQKRLGEEYAYFSYLYTLKRFSDVIGDTKPTEDWIRANKDKLSPYFKNF